MSALFLFFYFLFFSLVCLVLKVGVNRVSSIFKMNQVIIIFLFIKPFYFSQARKTGTSHKGLKLLISIYLFIYFKVCLNR